MDADSDVRSLTCRLSLSRPRPRQLLENLEETASCSTFEEASLSRKLNGETTLWYHQHNAP